MFLQVKDINKSYRKYGKIEKQQVLKDVNFTIKEGECVGLVGESGSGKSTLSRLILGLEKPDSGSILIEDLNVKKWIKENQGKMSVVFQDYTSSSNPNFTVKEIILEPLKVLGKKENLDKITEDLLDRYPHELSGGQLQRVCIARSISTKPKFIVLDEAISSLDVSIQAQILELLKDLKDELNITYLFIAHDLQVVTYLCDRIIFLYRGEVVENIHSLNLAYVKNSYAKRLLNSVIPFSI
ncbi:ABC transporter ATP-binding protein [Romboutsia sp.]|jgi:nickel transport system ATP-binding protein|uniref:ABC transporter ATP-binding protein n=1 Tax=Romboutsia sp. TaxID=1965302 RepID=UPI00216BEC31|nr:dipeptide/oligopeptide/nickel ABC transporter ATP-binding protein [Romboutsia sp.]MCI9061659.1 ABC transporter ATP-binding protein [Romboutsia sp.]